MPIYEYTCEKCGTRIDVLQKMDEPAPAACTSCSAVGTMARQVSRTSFVLKGGGWYSDLYGSSKKDVGATPNSSAPSTTTPTTTAAPASDSTKKDSGGTGNTGGSTPPASGGTPSSSGGGTSGSSASPA